MPKHSFLGKLLSDIQNTDDKCIRDTTHISNILDNILFLGSQYASSDDILVKTNITYVVSIGCSPLYNLDNIINHKFYIEDNGDKNNVTCFFDKIIPEIHVIIDRCVNDKKKLLVHCLAGRSRGAMVVITWLMKYKNIDYETAFNYVKERRPVISPNISFVDYVKT